MNNSSLDASLLKRILDTAQDGLLVFEAVRDETGNAIDLRLILVNEQAERIMNRPPEQLIGLAYKQLFPERNDRTGTTHMWDVLATGQPFQYETLVEPTVNSPLRWFGVSISKLDDGLVILFSDITARKQAEQERQESINLLESVFSSSLLGITVYETVTDQNGIIVDFRLQRINDAGLRMAGNPAGWVAGRTMKELNPAAETEGLFQQYVSVFQTKQPFQAERYYPTFKRWYSVMATYWYKGVVLTYQDITDRKETEQALQQQADTFAGVLRSMTNGLSVFSVIRDEQGNLADLRYDYVSDFMLEETGMDREQYIGHQLLTLFPDARKSRFWSAYEAALSTGQPQIFEEHYHYDGYDNYLHCQVTRLDADRLVSIYHNTNELHQARLHIQRQAETLQTVVNNTQAGLLLIAPIRDSGKSVRNGKINEILETESITDFKFLLTNKYNAQRAGKTVAEMTGQVIGDLFPGWQSSDLFNWFVEVIETGTNIKRTFPYEEFGWKGWYEGSFTKVGDGLLYAYIDVTSLKEAELNLQQQAQALEAANRELLRSNDNLQSFAYIASHDLQEPLRKIQAFGDLLLTQYAPTLDDTAHDYLHRMQGAAGRMSLLIRDLLAYSRLSSQQEPRQPVVLTDLINDVLNDLDVVVRESNAILTIDDLPTLSGDRMQLRQLFQNLLSNALKFRQPDQPPSIRISSRRVWPADLPTDVVLSALDRTMKPQAFVEISVADNGIGFDAKYASRIFQVFQRLHIRSQYEGSGVGLAICKRVAENHQGTIRATSQLGQGATFQVYLPV
jgi:signal transduction histidine kinase/PAS domain-containing protein